MNDVKIFKQYQLEGTTFYKYKKSGYLYHVDIFKYTNNEDGRFIMELVDSGEFETEEFIGLSIEKHAESDNPNIRYSKSISLLAAPDKFIQKNNIKQLENESKGSESRPDKGKRSGNGNKKTRVQKRTSNKG